MNINDVYGNTEWLRAADLQGKKVRVKISDWDMTAFKQMDGTTRNQIVLSFDGKEKKLGLNKTNSKMIASMYGDDTEQWIGKEIILCPQKTMNQQGNLVDCIRIEYETQPKTRVTQQGSTRATPKAAVQQIPKDDGPVYGDADFRDEVPF